jgi:hypothetical protein
MKKFTCREMGGVCDEVLEGETMDEVSKKGMAHVQGADDDAHKKIVSDMDTQGEEGKAKWTEWFKGEWDKKAEE